MTLSPRIIRTVAACLLVFASTLNFADGKEGALGEVQRRRRKARAIQTRKRQQKNVQKPKYQHQAIVAASRIATARGSSPEEEDERGRYGWDSPASTTVQFLLYETESPPSPQTQSLMKQLQQKLPGVNATVFGQAQGRGGFQGYGYKYSAVIPLLKAMDPESLVVICDSRDVLANLRPVWPRTATADFHATCPAVTEFQLHYQRLQETRPGAIVFAVQSQCCVSALTYASPGDYFHSNGRRHKHSCASGEAGCTGTGGTHTGRDSHEARPWKEFMTHRAVAEGFLPTMWRRHSHHHRDDANYDVYLHAGLVAGRARDLQRHIQNAHIRPEEDDQAVWTDYMHAHPNSVILDYGQVLFGNNRHHPRHHHHRRQKKDEMEDDVDVPQSCVYGWWSDFPKDETSVSHGERQLVHSQTLSSPLFLHSPDDNDDDRFSPCSEEVAAKLGVEPAAASIVRRRLGPYP